MDRRLFGIALLCAMPLAGCGSGSGPGGSPIPVMPPPTQSPPPGGDVGKYIKHVVVIVQENRTFDNIFAGFKGADSTMYGYTHTGAKVPLRAITFNGSDIYHDWKDAITDWNGGAMDGFDKNRYVADDPRERTPTRISGATWSRPTGRWHVNTCSPITCFRRCSDRRLPLT